MKKGVTMNPTDEQKDVRETGSQCVAQGKNLSVVAFAGAGKTSALKLLAEAIPKRGCYLAFNKSIADEAKRRLARSRCTASTMHSLAFGAVRDIISGPVTLNARDFRDSGILTKVHIPRVRGWNDYRISSAVLRTLSTFCNSADESIDINHAREALISATGDPDLIHVQNTADEVRHVLDSLEGPVADMATMYWRDNLENARFSHDIYLKLLDLDADLRNSAFREYRYLMLDEAQDTNPVQLSILRKTGLPLIAVGDPYQQIYSWRGAENAMAKIGGETRYLTQSFRFGDGIAETARKILASRPDGGPEQRLIGSGTGDISKHKGAKIAIICRTNIGMIDEAMRAMDRNLTVNVDNIQDLIGDVHSAQALFCGENHRITSNEIRQFESWDDFKAEAEEAGGSSAQLVRIVEQGRVSQVEKLAENQTDSLKANIQICTAHRSKGLEFPAVILGRDWRDVETMKARHITATKKSEKHATMAIEEWNAFYVASTRPILRLQGAMNLLQPSKTEKDPHVPEGYRPVDIHGQDRQPVGP